MDCKTGGKENGLAAGIFWTGFSTKKCYVSLSGDLMTLLQRNSFLTVLMYVIYTEIRKMCIKKGVKNNAEKIDIKQDIKRRATPQSSAAIKKMLEDVSLLNVWRGNGFAMCDFW